MVPMSCLVRLERSFKASTGCLNMYFKAGGQVKEREFTCTFSTLEERRASQGPGQVLEASRSCFYGFYRVQDSSDMKL